MAGFFCLIATYTTYIRFDSSPLTPYSVRATIIWSTCAIRWRCRPLARLDAKNFLIFYISTASYLFHMFNISRCALAIFFCFLLSSCFESKDPWFFLNNKGDPFCSPVVRFFEEAKLEYSSSDGPEEFSDAWQKATGRPSTISFAKDKLTATVTLHNDPDSGIPDPVYFFVRGEKQCKELILLRQKTPLN